MVARSLAAIPVLIFMVCILSWCRRRQETAPLQRDECPSLEYRFQSAAYNSLCTHSNNQRKRSSNDAANRLRELRQDGRARGGDQLPRQDVACRPPRQHAHGEEPGSEDRAPAQRGVHLQARDGTGGAQPRSEEHTSELQSLMRISYAVFCLKKKKTPK